MRFVLGSKHGYPVDTAVDVGFAAGDLEVHRVRVLEHKSVAKHLYPGVGADRFDGIDLLRRDAALRPIHGRTLALAGVERWVDVQSQTEGVEGAAGAAADVATVVGADDRRLGVAGVEQRRNKGEAAAASARILLGVEAHRSDARSRSAAESRVVVESQIRVGPLQAGPIRRRQSTVSNLFRARRRRRRQSRTGLKGDLPQVDHCRVRRARRWSRLLFLASQGLGW